MGETARILHFRARTASTPCAVHEAPRLALEYLKVQRDQRSEESVAQTLSDPDILSAICRLLREQRDISPQDVAEEASWIFRWIGDRTQALGVFDERDYFLGESAFIAGSAYRQLGRRREALLWLDRAEAAFRHTVNPGPGLSNIAYTRLALRFEMGQYEEVLELIPSVSTSFRKYGMDIDLAKSTLLQAMALKQCGRLGEALEILEHVQCLPAVTRDSALRARILAEVGDIHQIGGDFDQAIVPYTKAMALLENAAPSVALADLKMFVGSAYREHGHLDAALDALRSALVTYASLGMVTRVAYLRVFVADTLLALGRPREAEWEILAALPTIEEQKMVPEGLAAVALLKESVRRRKTDPNALRELREHLQARN